MIPDDPTGEFFRRKVNSIRAHVRRPALLFLAIIAMAVTFFAHASAPARAVDLATVSIGGEYVRIGGTATVTVTDPGASTHQVNSAETAGKTAYSIPVASAGDTLVFQTLNPLVMDKTGDGVVSAADVALSISNAIPTVLVPSSGVFTVQLTTDVTSPTPFTVTYWSERVDTLSVKVTSSSDLTGFSLTLQESLADSGVFTGTFDTGAATVTTNATSPTATARPDIKVKDKDVVTVAYTDTDPISIVNDTARVDGIAPSITQVLPAHNVYEQTFSSFFQASVTDLDSGVDVSSIRFHLDEDGDATFDEPGQVLLPDPLMTTEEPNGVVVRLRIPSTAPDGLRSWYVTAQDNAGALGRSDADPATAGNQNHVFTSDQNPPQVVSAVAGEWYDPVTKTVKTGDRNTVHVKFTEKLLVSSIKAPGFRFNGVPSLSAETVATLPNDVFIKVDSYPTEGPVVLMIDPGSVTDMAGIETSLVPVTVKDEVPPVLAINFDRTATNTLVNINVTSDEALAATPAITVNGLTRGVPTQISDREWQLVFNVATLTGVDAGQGTKTVGAFGFDESNTLGTASPAAFELDTALAGPTITPAGDEPVTEANPDITVRYPSEAGEYPGDTHNGVSLLFASLNGVPVTPLMSTPDGGATWVLKAADVRPEGYENGTQVFTVSAVDAAGNQHELAQTVFQVDVPPPPDPAPEPVSEPEAPEVEDVPTNSDAVDVNEVESGQGSLTSDEPATPATEEATPVEEPETTESPSSAADDAEAGDGASEETVETVIEPTTPIENAMVEPEDDQVPSEDMETAVNDAQTEEVAVAATVDDQTTESTGEAELVADELPVDESSDPDQNVDPVFDREAELAALDAQDDGTETSTPEGSGAVFGCNLPLSSSNVVGAEYALLGVGLLGLGLRKPVGALRDLLVPGTRREDR